MFRRKSVTVTPSLIPGPGHHLRESVFETREARESTDCPREDHSGLPARPDILLRLSGSQLK